MSSSIYDNIIEIENSFSKGIVNNELLDDNIMRGYVIITTEIDSTEIDEVTKNYLLNHFLNSLSSSILKDHHSSPSNFDIRREILLRILNIGLSELIKNNDKMISLFKQMFDIHLPFYENEAKFSKMKTYNFPSIITENDLLQKIHIGDDIEYFSKKRKFKIWKRGRIDKITATHLEIITNSNKLKILKINHFENKLALKGSYIQDSDWKFLLKEGDEIDLYIFKEWIKCTVMSYSHLNQSSNQKKITIGTGYYVNDNEPFLDTDGENRKYCGNNPKKNQITIKINSSKILKPNSVTKEGLLVNESCSNIENQNFFIKNDDEDITAYSPIDYPYKKFIMRKKEYKSPSFLELVRNFY